MLWCFHFPAVFYNRYLWIRDMDSWTRVAGRHGARAQSGPNLWLRRTRMDNRRSHRVRKDQRLVNPVARGPINDDMCFPPSVPLRK